MQSKRGIAINNSLVHGICNYSCTLCSVNKPGWAGPRQMQPVEVTATLVARVREAAREGLHVRYIANAGDGEPTLHPDFGARLALFGELLRSWPDDARHAAPEVSVVTNGARLGEPGVLEAFEQSPGLTMIVSLPTVDPDDYGSVMLGRRSLGGRLLARVLEGLSAAMALQARGVLRRLVIHVSPPDREVIRRGFDALVARLTTLARAAGLTRIELTMFPATANRAGLLQGGQPRRQLDMFADLFRRHHGSHHHGVEVTLHRVLDRFFCGPAEILELLRASAFPCLWNASLFITPTGDSICCNDQHARAVQGNLRQQSLAELMRVKERMLPAPICEGCDQSPTDLRGSTVAALYRVAARARLALARRGR